MIPAWINNASSNRYGPSQSAKNKTSDADGYERVDGSSVDQYVNIVHSCVSKEVRLRRIPIHSNRCQNKYLWDACGILGQRYIPNGDEMCA